MRWIYPKYLKNRFLADVKIFDVFTWPKTDSLDILGILALIIMQLYAKPLEVQIETPYAVLINAKTGKVLFEKQAYATIYPGSTTKIVTLLHLWETASDRLEELATCSEEALRVVSEETKIAKLDELPPYILELDGTTAYIKRYERLRVRDLIYSSILVSGNDAANVLAEHVAGDITTFMQGVNVMALTLGCKNTHFTNPHGLFHPDHTSCAYDMALITKKALEYPFIREVLQTIVYEIPKTNLQKARQIAHTNALIKEKHKFYYPFALGGKTGYFKKAKYNIVAVASNGEREVIAAIHKSPSSNQRYQDCIALFDAAFAEMKTERLLFAAGETSFKKGITKGKRDVEAVLEEDLRIKYYPSEEEDVEAKLEWKEMVLPVKRGSVVADLVISAKSDGRELLRKELVAREDVDKKQNWWWFLWVALPALLGVLLAKVSQRYKDKNNSTSSSSPSISGL